MPDGQRIMTCSRDGSLRVWNLKSGRQIGDDWPDGDNAVCTIALSPDGKKVVSESMDGEVRYGHRQSHRKMDGNTKQVRTVWSGDARRVLSGSEDGTARQWDAESGYSKPCQYHPHLMYQCPMLHHRHKG